jgi:N-acetylmuramoyl-L-alanine amidase
LAVEDETKKDLEEQKKKWLIETIVVDAGHGGKDPGAVGYDGVKEKDIVLPIALKLGEMIKEKMLGVKVVYTRSSDVFIPLWQRTKMANEANGKLFVSLHCNSNPNKNARGFETYFLSADKDEKAKDVVLKENEAIQFEESSDKEKYSGVNFVLATMAQNAFMRQSKYLASSVQDAMHQRLQVLDLHSRGVKQGPFWVMVGATMPNILIELGFVSNKYESKILRQKASQVKIADAIYSGIEKYKKDIESAI